MQCPSLSQLTSGTVPVYSPIENVVLLEAHTAKEIIEDLPEVMVAWRFIGANTVEISGKIFG